MPLGAMLMSRFDVKVPVGNWRWSVDCPYPPLEMVLKAPFWTQPAYEAARARLLRPAAQIVLKSGADFITINTLTQKATVVPESATAAAEDEVCSCPSVELR